MSANATAAKPRPPAPRDSTLSVAIVGATGAVGQELLQVLTQRGLPVGELRLLASERSAGRTLPFRGEDHVVKALDEQSFRGVDLALFSAGGSISKRFAPLAAEAGAVVVDNSSAFRMDPASPLIVPEVNPDALGDIRVRGSGGGGGAIIANPNCSTIIMLVAVHPLHTAAGVKRIVVSTYQAASGAGAAAMQELRTQTRESLEGVGPDQLTQDIFGRPYAFNLFSHDSDIGPDGYNTEETKMVRETHKIWGQDAPGTANHQRVAITATCVRVPVMRAHAESINLTFDRELGEAEARELLQQAPGVRLVDDRAGNQFPTPLAATHRDEVLVGRLRRDISQPDGRGLDLFVCGDQVRKGAALNAVQIAELVIANS
jgi:aspartate-semialdehyde dehydrogenase